MFKEERDESSFSWDMLGDIAAGRPNLGSAVDVAVYRLMQTTMRDVMIKKFNVKTADQVFYESGEVAGRAFCRKLIDKEDDFLGFINQAKQLLLSLNIGILRVEKSDLEKMAFTVTVAEDLDCSGLPVTDETICKYDEGFLSGMLAEYSGKAFDVKEVDCWCSGDRVCRFDIKPRN